jgi:hypothetical protein
MTGSSPGSTHTQSIGGGDPARVAIDPRCPHPARTARALETPNSEIEAGFEDERHSR